MRFITGILKEEKRMKEKNNNLIGRIQQYISKTKGPGFYRADDRVYHPFNVIVQKEISDHVRSWRFIILLVIISLTCLGSMYTAMSSIKETIKPNDPEGSFVFLKLFTSSDGILPSFVVFLGFLGPLLGISLGFDAVNSEQSKGTLSRIISQPIHRDYILNAKFMASLIVVSVMFFALGFLVMGFGLISIGIPPTPGEFLRIIIFIFISIIYVAFWLNLSIVFSVKFRQPATAALSGIAIWLFFAIFYEMIVDLIMKGLVPPTGLVTEAQMINFENFRLNLLRISPSQLFSDATTTLLMPNVRSLGPLSLVQVIGTIPGPLSLTQSLMLVWPQVTGLIAATIICFVISYVSFMRKEIRSR